MKYKFNFENLSYEVQKESLLKKIIKSCLLFLVSLVLFSAYYIISTQYLDFDTYKTSKLKLDNLDIKSKLEFLSFKLDENNAQLNQLQMRDNNLYRPIFGMEELSADMRNGGFGGVDRYSHLYGKGDLSTLLNVEHKMDVLYKKAFIQSKSYDEISILSEHAEKISRCVPAIPPVSLKNTRFSSGYGVRNDPFEKVPTMHSGIDFSGKKGEPIYATGDGKVVRVSFSFTDYGHNIVVDHGFGYKTRYAHLSKINVKKGDIVSRGDQIGDMGSTGKSTSDHLHYEVIYMNKRVNPVNYYNKNIKEEAFQQIVANRNKKAVNTNG